jgi:hypothetical protein
LDKKKKLMHKIGFFVGDKRHFDYFKNVFDALHEISIPFDMVINDTRNEVNAIISDDYNHSMVGIAQSMGYPYQLLSDVIQSRKKYAYVVTTYSFKYTIRTDLPRIPERLFHFFVNGMIRVSAVLKLRTVVDHLTKSLISYDLKFRTSPEQAIGEKVILFPKGLDLNLNKFPDPSIIDQVDEYFCHGNIDRDLIHQKTEKIATVIGYPRYDTLNTQRSELISNLQQEYKLATDKKLISWIPTYVMRDGNPDFNFDNWLPYVQPLLDEYEIIIRPHPKRIEKGAEELVNRFQSMGFHVDLLAERDMNQLYAASDFILCDYGGVVFSSIYTDSNLIMLNHANHNEEKEKQRHLLVYQVREKLQNIYIGDVEKAPDSLRTALIDATVWNNQKEIRKSLRKECFGGVESGEGSHIAARKLKELLDIR